MDEIQWLQWLLERLLKRAASVCDAFQSRLPTLPGRWLLVLSAGGLVAYALFVRCLNLFNTSHHYLISVDSYFFHWLAGKVMAGEELPAGALPGAITGILHSGLAYPLAYIAKATSYVFGLSSGDALDLVSKFLPPIIAVISMALLYLAAARIFNRRVALFAAIAWAIMTPATLIGAAGYLDRDGLSMLLVMAGAFLFYFSKGWHFRIRNRDVGWLLVGMGVLVIEGILYLEWSFVGPVLLLAIILVYSAVRFLLGYFTQLEREPNVLRRFASAAGTIEWRTLGVIVLAHAVFAAFNAHQAVDWFNFATMVVSLKGQSFIQEMAGITAWDFLRFGFFLVPMAIALFLAWRRRAEGAIFASCWFLCLLIMSLFARRVLGYAAPTACLLSGIGLAFLWNWMKQGEYRALKKTGVAVLLLLLIIPSFSLYQLSSNPRYSVDEEWQDALAYIRDNTHQEAVIMAWWDWGYWILDVGQRKPVVDNGFYGWDLERLRDVALIYTSTESTEAAQIMRKYGAEYLVFSTLEMDIATPIMSFAGDEYKGLDAFPWNSLVLRILNGEFDSGNGLEVVHRSIPDSDVVILRLSPTEQT